MADPRATWKLVLPVVRGLTAQGRTTFLLADIVEGVQGLDHDRARSSIQPVVQGMARNAGRGPQQPCGKVLLRTDHGWYRVLAAGELEELAAAQPTSGPRGRWRSSSYRAQPRPDIPRRVSEVIQRFDELVAECDRSVPFRRRGQYERHRQTIDCRLELGSARAAIGSPVFTGLLYETLQLWGIRRRASRLVPLDAFRDRLVAVADAINALDGLCIESAGLDADAVAASLDRLVSDVGVVDNKALLVAGTKTLHHLLPDLVPPMDRRWTGAFFGWWPIDPQDRQCAILSEAYRSFAEIAQAVEPSRLIGAGWKTSTTKMLDNAVVAYCSLNGIRPRG